MAKIQVKIVVGHSIDKEKWSVDFEKLKKQATEALEHLQKVEDSLL